MLDSDEGTLFTVGFKAYCIEPTQYLGHFVYIATPYSHHIYK
jgi:hypothetical protein